MQETPSGNDKDGAPAMVAADTASAKKKQAVRKVRLFCLLDRGFDDAC